MISEAKRKSAKCKLKNENCKMPDEDPGVVMEKLHGVWNRHVSGEARLLRPAAEFVGAVLAGEEKLAPGSKAYNKAVGLLEVAAPGPKPQASRLKPPVSPATRIPEAESPAADNALRGEGRDIPIDAIVASPFNPRTEFDEAELISLAQSIEAHGLLEPIVVRPLDNGRYELVAGERRWKACQHAGLAKVPSVVRRLDDQQAKELCVLENLQRKDLSPIEEAEGFRMLLDGPKAPTQAELGARLGISQGQIANRLGLLRLPDSWRKRIANGEITATHARALVPYADRPKLLKEIEKGLKWALDEGSIGNAEAFENDVEDEVARHTRRLKGERYCSAGVRVSHFTPTEDQRKELDIMQVAGDNGKPIEVACNTALWDKLQKAHETQYMARKVDGKAKPAQPAAKDRKLTPAEKKAEQARRKERENELAQQFAKRLTAWRADWLRYLIARELAHADEVCGDRRLIRVLLFLAASPGTFRTLGDIHERATLLAERMKAANVPAKIVGPSYARCLDVWTSIAPLPSQGLNDVLLVARDFARNMFWSDDGPGQTVPPEDVEAIAAWLKIDLAATWKREQAGPLTETYLALHSKEQLTELAAGWGVFVKPDTTPKGTMIRMLVIKDRPTTLPKELAKGGRGR